MSIWQTWDVAGGDGPGDVRSYATGWSNHFPDDQVEQPSSVMLGTIPSWCVPGHEDEYSDALGEWLQLTVIGWKHDFHNPGTKPTEREVASVSMDQLAVKALRDELTRWLDTPKVKAKGEA